MSERSPDDLDRLDAPIASMERVEFFSLGSLSDWIDISNWVDRGVTITVIILSISLKVKLRSTSCDRRFSSPSLANSPELWASPSSTNCLVGVGFSLDIIVLPV